MNKKKWLVLGAVLFLTLALLAGCGKEEGGQADGEKKAGWVVGTSADYEPFEFVDEKGEYVGFDMELVKEVAKRMDMDLKIEDMEFGSLLASLEKGRIDAIIAAMSADDERRKQADFTIPYHESAQGVLVKNDSGIEINELDDLLPYTIAVQTGTTLDEWATAKIAAGELEESKVFRYSDANAAAMDVEIGRVETFFLDLPPARAYAKEYDKLELVFEGKLPDAEGQCIAIPKGSEEMAKRLNAIITELKEEGFIEELEDKWLS
jgi:polar amino acid transport system substrate-binding protein